MERTQRIFISDIHMGNQLLYDSGDALYQNNHRNRLVSFLYKQIIEKSNQIKDVILLGDIFDNWVCPANIPPPTWEEFFTDNKKEVAAFKHIISNGINLFYIPGNHDFDAHGDILKQHIPGIRLIKSYKGAGRSHAEHGHEYTLFNRPDFFNDPGFGRPIGYYLARLFASCPKSGDSFNDIIEYLEDIINDHGEKESIFSLLIESLSQRADKHEIKMPDNKTLSVKAVKKRFRYLGRQQGVNSSKLAMYIIREKFLGEVADDLCKKWGFNIVLFGHTHFAKIDKDLLFSEDRVYANTGTWCSKKAHFLIIDKPPESRTIITLSQVNEQGDIIDQETCHLDSRCQQ